MTELYDAPYLDEAEHALTDHTGIPGVGGGGGFTPPDLTAYALWERGGAAIDGSTGSFDFTVDQTSVDPTGAITVEFVTGYGVNLPVLNQPGLYAVKFRSFPAIALPDPGDYVRMRVTIYTGDVPTLNEDNPPYIEASSFATNPSNAICNLFAVIPVGSEQRYIAASIITEGISGGVPINTNTVPVTSELQIYRITG